LTEPTPNSENFYDYEKPGSLTGQAPGKASNDEYQEEMQHRCGGPQLGQAAQAGAGCSMRSAMSSRSRVLRARQSSLATVITSPTRR
jgi:hypothetical protein